MRTSGERIVTLPSAHPTVNSSLHSQLAGACSVVSGEASGTALVHARDRSTVESIGNCGTGSYLLAGDFGSTSEWFKATASKKLAQINAPPITTPRSISANTPNEDVGNTSAQWDAQQVY